MEIRWQTIVVVLCLPLLLRADVFRRNGKGIAVTEGIEPGPGVQLAHRDLAYADLSQEPNSQTHLREAGFEASNLIGPDLRSSILTDANPTGAHLTGTSFASKTVTRANRSRAGLTMLHEKSPIQLTKVT